jgi:hypothetical protein
LKLSATPAPAGESRLEKTPDKGDNRTMTDFLFARPSFLEGIGRNIGLFGMLNLYDTSQLAGTRTGRPAGTAWHELNQAAAQFAREHPFR